MKNFIKLLIFILINILVLEGILSFFDPELPLVRSYDKELLFSMYPYKKGKVVSEEFSITVNTNSDGFRQKLPIQYDTILLGDSFSEGWGIEEGNIFVDIMNEKLKDGSKILNLGIHGSSPILYALQIKPFLDRYKPKKVIIQLFDNDLDDNDKLERFISLDPDGKVIGIQENKMAVVLGSGLLNYLKSSSLYRLFQKIAKAISKTPHPILYYKPGKEPALTVLSHVEALEKFGPLKPLGNNISTAYNGQFEFYSDPDSDQWKKRFSKNKIYLEQIVQICKENNVELSFVYIPAKEFFAKGGILGNISSGKLSEYNKNNPFYLQIKEICYENNLVCAYTNELFFSEYPQSLYYPFDAHLNTKGHKVLAEKLLKVYNP